MILDRQVNSDGILASFARGIQDLTLDSHGRTVGTGQEMKNWLKKKQKEDEKRWKNQKPEETKHKFLGISF